LLRSDFKLILNAFELFLIVTMK